MHALYCVQCTQRKLIGRAVQALVGAFYADQAALPQSERGPADVPGPLRRSYRGRFPP